MIAEAGVNHNGQLDLARRLIDAALAAGADAVKFQTFVPDEVATLDAPKAEYQQRHSRTGESQLEMLRRVALSPSDFEHLAAYSAMRGITFLSTAADQASLDLLEALGVPALKVGSGEVTNLPLLAAAGRKQMPVVLSTGMSTLEEVHAAFDTLVSAGAPHIALLHCVSNYPADPADANLRAMMTLRETFNVPIGYSDHTLGTAVSLAAVAMGANIIEKHFTLDRELPGPDHQASLDVDEFGVLVAAIRVVERALGDGRKVPTARERPVAAVARRSLVAATFISAGTRVTPDVVAQKRPGTGIPPAALNELLGSVARVDVEANTLLTWDMFDAGNGVSE